MEPFATVVLETEEDARVFATIVGISVHALAHHELDQEGITLFNLGRTLPAFEAAVQRVLPQFDAVMEKVTNHLEMVEAEA